MKTAIVRSNLECNLGCLFCTAADDTSEKMDTANFKKKIIDFKKKNIKHLVITGGEPTLRKDLPKIISFARSKGIKKINLQSNAILFSDENYLLTLKMAGLDFVTVGISSHKKATYNHLTNSKLYDKAILGIRNLVDNDIEVSVYHVINSENYKDLIKFVDFIQSISKKIRFTFAFLRPNGNTLKNKHLVPKLKDIDFHLNQLFTHLENKKIKTFIEGVPLCYLSNFENKSIETKRIFTIDTPYVSEDEIKHESLYDDINKELKRKPSTCNSCFVNNICVGVWREYADIHGLSELYPIFIDDKKLRKEYQ